VVEIFRDVGCFHLSEEVTVNPVFSHGTSLADEPAREKHEHTNITTVPHILGVDIFSTERRQLKRAKARASRSTVEIRFSLV